MHHKQATPWYFPREKRIEVFNRGTRNLYVAGNIFLLIALWIVLFGDADRYGAAMGNGQGTEQKHMEYSRQALFSGLPALRLHHRNPDGNPKSYHQKNRQPRISLAAGRRDGCIDLLPRPMPVSGS